ncbi:MAG TPA: glycosyltransferase family 39 protein, partial [Candidatus Kryptonia bacterium]|nr:glycosyltransferase family 39 protein [Candidatus Kryptonia bacterium]
MSVSPGSVAQPAAAPSWAPGLRAIVAIGAVVLAAVGQLLLERARLQGIGPPSEAGALFLAAAVLAVAAAWKRNESFSGTRAFALFTPTWRWWLACAPGLLSLVLATVFEGTSSTRTVFLLWAGGIALLFAVGAAHAVGMRSRQRWRPPGDWPASRVVLGYLILIAVAVAMRTALGIQYLPAFVESDEAWGAMSARALGQDPYAWFGLWDAGCNKMALVPIRAAVLVFGESLWGVRMGGMVMGTICVLCTFAFARRLVGNLPAFTAALLVAVAHVLVHWSRNGHGYIWVPTGAAVILWLFVRVWTGGSLLSWIGTAVVLGIASQVYYAAYAFPPLLIVTAVGWAVIGRVNWKAVVLSTLAIELIALLIFAPQLKIMLNNPELATVRARWLFILSPENTEKMGGERTHLLLAHAKDTLAMFNTGYDSMPNYGAKRSLVDAVTAVLIPVAAAMVLVRLFSPVGWLCATWWATYLFIGVFLEAHPPSYHRIPAAILFSSLAVAWALAQLAATIRDGFRLRRSSVGVI